MSSCCTDSGSRAASHLTVRQGASFVVRWPVTTLDGTPVDVSTWTLRAQARPRTSSSTVLYTWSQAAGNALTTSDGWLYLTISPAQSAAFTWRRAVYDVELQDPAGNVTKVAAGKLCVQPEVTR